jgi:hypothetical protein
MRKCQSRCGVNLPAGLQEKCVKQTDVKRGLVALYGVREAGDNAGVYKMQGTGNTVAGNWRTFLFTLSVGRFVSSGLETGERKRLQSELRY